MYDLNSGITKNVNDNIYLIQTSVWLFQQSVGLDSEYAQEFHFFDVNLKRMLETGFYIYIFCVRMVIIIQIYKQSQ